MKLCGLEMATHITVDSAKTVWEGFDLFAIDSFRLGNFSFWFQGLYYMYRRSINPTMKVLHFEGCWIAPLRSRM